MASMTRTAVSAKQMETLPALLPPFIQHSVRTPAMAAARLETAELHSSRPGEERKGESNAKDKACPESRVLASSMGILSDTSGHWKCGKEGKAKRF